MNCIIISILLILLLILTLICIYQHSKDDENFQYATLYNYYNRYPRKRGYNYYNRYKKSKIDPGFGNRMWELESAPEWNDNDYNLLAKYPQPGNFGKLVSYLEDRNNATAIKNLPV